MKALLCNYLEIKEKGLLLSFKDFKKHCSRLVLYMIIFTDFNFNSISNFEVCTLQRLASNLTGSAFEILFWDIQLIDYDLRFWLSFYDFIKIPALYVNILISWTPLFKLNVFLTFSFIYITFLLWYFNYILANLLNFLSSLANFFFTRYQWPQ